MTGEIEWDSLARLAIPDYQREEIPKQIQKVYEAAFNLEPINPIEVCSRGTDFDLANKGENSQKLVLKDNVYIIDGQQRRAAFIKIFREGANDKVSRLRVTIYLGTNEKWESERFNIVNFMPIKVSPSVYMKNQRLNYQSVDILYRLTQERDSALYGKVQWSQAKNRQNIFTSLIYGSSVGCLLAGREIKATKNELPKRLEELLEKYGEEAFRNNARTMFEIYNEIWNIDSFTFSDKVIQVKGNFVRAFGLFLGQHDEFWRTTGSSRELMVPARVTEKLKRFPVEERITQATFESTKMAVIAGARLFTEYVNKNVRIEENKLSLVR
jgi:hypothetical protein